MASVTEFNVKTFFLEAYVLIQDNYFHKTFKLWLLSKGGHKFYLLSLINRGFP